MIPKTLTPLLSSRRNDWETPRPLFDALNREWDFDLDAAASADNTLLPRWLGPGSPLAEDALTVNWADYGRRIFCNPPYSHARVFIEKAADARSDGAIVVLLLAARPDTRAWQDHLWDEGRGSWRPGVRGTFLRGRLKFGGALHGAPFPSAIVVLQRQPLWGMS